MLGTLIFVAVAVTSEAKVVHPEPILPHEWTQHNSLLSSVTFRISLKQLGTEELYRIARRVSDPSDSMYGKYLTQTELDELVAPGKHALNTVMQWASKASCSASVLREVVTISCDIAGAEALLETECRMVENSKTKQHAVRCSEYSLPDDVHEATQAVYGLHGLPMPPRKANESPPSSSHKFQGASQAAAKVTPAVIRSTYKISGVTPSGSQQNRQAVAEFQGQTMSSEDLDIFWKTFMNDTKQELGKVHKYVGDMGEGSGEIEADLDIQYIMGAAPGILTEFWFFKPMDFCGDLKNWTQMLLATASPPLVHSVSYGYQGPIKNLQSILGCKLENINDVDADFAKLAARGITIIFASGDSGAYYMRGQTICSGPQGPPTEPGTELVGTVKQTLHTSDMFGCCLANSQGGVGYTYTGEGECKIYSKITGKKPSSNATSAVPTYAQVELFPSWPASSPWVTSVGSTRFVNQAVGQPEMATDRFGSGGGFSTMFDAFAGQKADIEKYFKVAPELPPDGMFPSAGRGTPDVAALGDGFQVVIGGRITPVGGTSASAPTFAGLVSLLNEARLAKQMAPMGFLNPWLYNNADAFTDITRGDNYINHGGRHVQYGYNCTGGWDPVTGLGTPLFDKMLSAAIHMRHQLVV